MFTFSQAILRHWLQHALLVQPIVIETEFSVIPTRPHGADNVDALVSCPRGKLASAVYQLGAQATMLGVVDASVLQLFHATINASPTWSGKGRVRLCSAVLDVAASYSSFSWAIALA